MDKEPARQILRERQAGWGYLAGQEREERRCAAIQERLCDVEMLYRFRSRFELWFRRHANARDVASMAIAAQFSDLLESPERWSRIEPLLKGS
jgi:hypothetical protein